MKRNNLIQRPSPIKCPKKYCYFWCQEMNENSDSGYCSCLLGYCTRLNLFQGDNDYYEPNEPELEKDNFPVFYFIKSLDDLCSEARREVENEYYKYFSNCPERWVTAKIKWLKDLDKRREKYKKYKVYSTASRFSGMKDNESWSIYSHYINDIDDEWSKFGLCFLADSAPNNLLKSGNRFELFENGICGIGEVL